MRRTYGTGSITQYNNKYIARVKVDGKTKKKTFLSHIAATRWLQEINDSKIRPTEITTGKWLTQYIDKYKEPFLRKRSLQRVKQAASHLKPLYDVPLQDLTPGAIQTAINGIGLSASSIKKSYELLQSALNQAIAERIISTNPCDTVVRPQTQKKPKIEVFTRKELGKIILAIHKIQRYKYNSSQRYNMILFFRLLLYTGMRVSELLALKWENVNTEAHTIAVTGSKDIDSQDINAPKTEDGIRTIPLLSVKTRKMLYDSKPEDTSGDTFIFVNKNGGAMSYHRAFLTWDRIRELTGINKKIHCFRHTCISYLLTYYNIPIAQVAAIAGHASPNITLNVYTHAIKEYNLQKITNPKPT